MILRRYLIFTLLVAGPLGGCAPQPIINIVDNTPKPPVFGERERPAVTAAITGAYMAQPSRKDIAQSWIKRHIYTEGAPTETQLSFGPAPTPTPQRSTAVGVSPPKTILTPNDFNPNNLQ